ncbi:hypothetical protein KQX54_017945 [Cotesia glomerata]|uniref:Uncharacterized protein n=1 Tax=Cotesia glomerata TaxID=32391 RepID=A0AAV7I6A7_COTGL|nr:hypothetical protein KQX54_017945 [Cotesia glomerata]
MGSDLLKLKLGILADGLTDKALKAPPRPRVGLMVPLIRLSHVPSKISGLNTKAKTPEQNQIILKVNAQN